MKPRRIRPGKEKSLSKGTLSGLEKEKERVSSPRGAEEIQFEYEAHAKRSVTGSHDLDHGRA